MIEAKSKWDENGKRLGCWAGESEAKKKQSINPMACDFRTSAHLIRGDTFCPFESNHLSAEIFFET